MTAIEALEKQLRVASSNNTALQRQQAQLMESVHTLINMVASTTGRRRHAHTLYRQAYGIISTIRVNGLLFCVCVCVLACVYVGSPPRSQMWRDCADAYKAGHSVSGVYNIYISNRTQPVQVNV